jgi:hypothetical protein
MDYGERQICLTHIASFCETKQEFLDHLNVELDAVPVRIKWDAPKTGYAAWQSFPTKNGVRVAVFF